MNSYYNTFSRKIKTNFTTYPDFSASATEI